MGSEPVFGCWEWDGDANCIVNSVTSERLRYLGEALPDASPWQGRFHALRYEADDFACPIVVRVTQALRSGRRSGLFWRSLEPELVTLYQVDFTLSAQIDGHGTASFPFGAWQRLIEFVPQAILFWPCAWPDVADPANGPGQSDAARCVRTIGAWANGSWRPEIGIEFVIENPSKLDPTAPLELLDKEKWKLADLAETPAPPFVFMDRRTAEDAATDYRPWPDPEGVKHWLAAQGFADALPEGAHVEVPADLFDRVPHCRSDDGSRHFFLERGIEHGGRHSPPRGPDWELVTDGFHFSIDFSGANEITEYVGGKIRSTNKLRGEILYPNALDMKNGEADIDGSLFIYYVYKYNAENEHILKIASPQGRRIIWQSTLDAIVAWQPTQGIYPATRSRNPFEVEAEPGPSIVPQGAKRMLPFAWIKLELTGFLGGIYLQPEFPQRVAHDWRSWKSYVILDIGEYSGD